LALIHRQRFTDNRQPTSGSSAYLPFNTPDLLHCRAASDGARDVIGLAICSHATGRAPERMHAALFVIVVEFRACRQGDSFRPGLYRAEGVGSGRFKTCPALRRVVLR
jgi:hypothetical protein